MVSISADSYLMVNTGNFHMNARHRRVCRTAERLEAKTMLTSFSLVVDHSEANDRGTMTGEIAMCCDASAGPLTLLLSSSNTRAAKVPRWITIPVHEQSVEFPITMVDAALLSEGVEITARNNAGVTQTVTIEPMASDDADDSVRSEPPVSEPDAKPHDLSLVNSSAVRRAIRRIGRFAEIDSAFADYEQSPRRADRRS